MFYCYRIKKKLSEAERLVGRLQVLKAEAAEQELALQVQADPNQPAANRACCICLIRPRNTVFVPCGHLDVCDTCAGILRHQESKENPKGITSVRSAEVKLLRDRKCLVYKRNTQRTLLTKSTFKKIDSLAKRYVHQIGIISKACIAAMKSLKLVSSMTTLPWYTYFKMLSKVTWQLYSSRDWS